MDSKITKRRLNDFLAYEWIVMIVVVVVAIIVWELIYTVSAVRLTTGQVFKIYYDETLNSTGQTNLTNMLDEKGTLSYDVLSLDIESLSSEYNVLSTRLSVQEGDILITDTSLNGTDETESAKRSSLFKSNVDAYSLYDMDSLYADLTSYLQWFLKTDKTVDDLANFDNLDTAKIESNFRSRMKNDNRFRTEEKIQAGIIKENARLKRLCEDRIYFASLLTHEEYFNLYTRYEYAYNSLTTSDSNYATYKAAYEKEIADGRENLKYGVNFFAMNATASDYFKVATEANANNVAVTVFNFKGYQYDLQYETVSFICDLARTLLEN